MAAKAVAFEPLFVGRLGEAADEFGDGVDEGSGDADGGGKEEGVETEDVLVAGGPEGEGDEAGGADAESDGGGGATWNAEGAMEVGLAEAEDDEGDELEEEGGAVEDEVDGDEALEGEAEGEAPDGGAGEDADPGDSELGAAEEDMGGLTVFCHGEGDAGDAHHEGIEHADAVDHAARDDSESEQRAGEDAGGVGPGTCRELAGGEACEGDRGERKDVGESDQGGGSQHGAGVVVLRVFDFLGDGAGVIPAHVVPHGDGDGAGEIGCGDGLEEGSGAVAVPGPEAGGDEHDKGSEKDAEERNGRLADGFGSGEIPEGAAEDDGEGPEGGAVASGPGGSEAAEVENEDGGVDGHVEYAGGEGEPRFLKAPKAAESAADPDVEAAFGGDGAGEFTDHERGGQAPDEGDDGEEEEGAAVAGFADDVFEAVGSAGDHEVSGAEEGDEAHLTAGGEVTTEGAAEERRGGRVRREVDGGDLLKGE